MKSILGYVDQRLKDIEVSMKDGWIVSSELTFLKGQKDELETLRKVLKSVVERQSEELKVRLNELENTTDIEVRDYRAGVIYGLEKSLLLIEGK